MRSSKKIKLMNVLQN